MHWSLFELYARSRQLEVELNLRHQPVRSHAGPGWRRPIARKLINLGLALDAGAATPDRAPHLRNSDA